MPHKRPAPPVRASRRVRPRNTTSNDPLASISLEDRAEPFRLMTVKFPIDDVTPQWSLGSNRDVDAKQVRRLCELFREHGLQRRDRAHRIRLLCSARDVKKMCERLGIECQRNEHGTDLPVFTGWLATTSSTAEMLAGNHRVQALQAYLQEQNVTDEAERWWVGDIFDKGKSPHSGHSHPADIGRSSSCRPPDRTPGQPQWDRSARYAWARSGPSSHRMPRRTEAAN
ncbi:hypothetical protein MRB53_038455 [Persea americana]|nr:hypothetical protein MRB53_038455 [Persea americana]